MKKRNKNKFTAKKGEMTFIGKLTQEEMQELAQTGQLPERIKNAIDQNQEEVNRRLGLQ